MNHKSNRTTATKDGEESYYDILGVDRTVAPDELTKKWKNLLRKHHPDRIKDPEEKKKAEVITQKINEAYDVLNDPQKRKTYDTFGREGLNGGGADHHPFSGFTNLEDIILGMHGGNPFGHPGKRKAMIQSVQVAVQLTLDQLFHGCEMKKEVERFSICRDCNNTGYKDKMKHVCTRCKGQGFVVITQRMGNRIMQQQGPCHDCQGSGKDTKNADKCTKCRGEGIVQEKHEISFKIGKGMSQGDVVTLSGEGHEAVLEKDPERGDVVVIIEEIPHPIFKRRDANANGKGRASADLEMTMSIRLHEAICGFVKTFDFLDGKTYHVYSDQIINNGDIRMIRGLGMVQSNGYGKGDLFVKFEIQKTDKLNQKRKALIYKVLTGKEYVLTEPSNSVGDEGEINLVDLQEVEDQATNKNNVYESDDEAYENDGPAVQCTHQ